MRCRNLCKHYISVYSKLLIWSKSLQRKTSFFPSQERKTFYSILDEEKKDAYDLLCEQISAVPWWISFVGSLPTIIYIIIESMLTHGQRRRNFLSTDTFTLQRLICNDNETLFSQFSVVIKLVLLLTPSSRSRIYATCQ